MELAHKKLEQLQFDAEEKAEKVCRRQCLYQPFTSYCFTIMSKKLDGFIRI